MGSRSTRQIFPFGWLLKKKAHWKFDYYSAFSAEHKRSLFMKKLVSLLLAAALMLAMTSCGNDSGSESGSESSLSSLESSESSIDSSLDDSENASEPESSSSEEVPSSENSSEQESSSASVPESKPAQNKPSTSSKPASSSKPTENSKPESQPSSGTTQKPPIPKPESSNSNSSSTSKPSTSISASAVYDAMDSAVAARHEGIDAAIMNMPMSIDDSTLSDMFGVSVSDVVGYKGVYAGSMTNCDIMLVVEAKDGKVDAVKKALQDKQAAQKKQFEHYGVMGNIERLDASKVVSNGNFVALIIVGIIGDGEENYDCAGDVSAANSAFTNALKK